MKVFIKQPRDHLDYDIVLSDWLTGEDEIVNADVTAPDGIEITQIGIEPDRLKLWVKGGSTGMEYKVSPLIYTKSREKEVDLLFIIEDV